MIRSNLVFAISLSTDEDPRLSSVLLFNTTERVFMSDAKCYIALDFGIERKFRAASFGKEKIYDFMSLCASRHDGHCEELWRRYVAHCPDLREILMASNHPRTDFIAPSI